VIQWRFDGYLDGFRDAFPAVFVRRGRTFLSTQQSGVSRSERRLVDCRLEGSCVGAAEVEL
jgi:hypothetical protein